MYVEGKTDKINWKNSTAHVPSPGKKRTDNMTNAGCVSHLWGDSVAI